MIKVIYWGWERVRRMSGKAEVLITRAASNLRKAANADRKRRAELMSMAEYLVDQF